MLYAVIQEPKRRNKHYLATALVLIEARSQGEAIRRAAQAYSDLITTSPEYSKPYAEECGPGYCRLL